MATVIWTGGAGDGNMNTGGNYAGAAAPSGGDTVIFNQGSANVTTWTTVALAVVTVTKGYSGTFGTASTAVSVTDTVTTMRLGGRGSVYNLTVPTTKAITTCTLETVNAVFAGAGTLTTLNVAGGSTATVSTTALATLNVVGPDDVCDVATSATAITLANVTGRLTTTGRNITTLVADASSARVTTYGSTTGTGSSTAAVATGTFSSGAIYNKQSAATDTTLTVKAGALLTNKGNLNQEAVVTTLNLWTGGKYVTTGPGNTLTITNPVNNIGPSGGDGDFGGV